MAAPLSKKQQQIMWNKLNQANSSTAAITPMQQLPLPNITNYQLLNGGGLITNWKASPHWKTPSCCKKKKISKLKFPKYTILKLKKSVAVESDIQAKLFFKRLKNTVLKLEEKYLPDTVINTSRLEDISLVLNEANLADLSLIKKYAKYVIIVKSAISEWDEEVCLVGHLLDKKGIILQLLSEIDADEVEGIDTIKTLKLAKSLGNIEDKRKVKFILGKSYLTL
jgi:hypothetical protein